MDNRRNQLPSTYMQAGFNGFMRRSIDSDGAATLRQASTNYRMSNRQTLNFDQVQTTGKLGDTIQVGDILIDGKKHRISIYDDGRVNETGRIGNLDD